MELHGESETCVSCENELILLSRLLGGFFEPRHMEENVRCGETANPAVFYTFEIYLRL